MVKVIANHTLETLRDIKNSLKYYYSKGKDTYSDAIEQEEKYYRDVLRQTTE
jgi:hypothetical protein